jgi:hypothetical protein
MGYSPNNFPYKINKHIDPKFVAKLTILALAKYKIKTMITIKATTKNFPFQAHKKPSYIPIQNLFPQYRYLG